MPNASRMPLSQYIGLGFDPYGLNYQRDKQAQGNLDDYLALAADIVRRIEEAGGGLQGRGAWAEPMVQGAISKALTSPGMSPGEYAAAKGRVSGTFRAATGGLAKATGNRGYFSPSGVAQAAGNAPAAALGQGLADLEARNQEIARRERETGLSALTSLTPGLMEEARRPQEAFGGMIGQYIAGTPLMANQRRRRYW